MKVLIIRNSFAYDFGGAERLAVLIAEQLKLNNVDPIVVSHHDQVLAFAHTHKIKSLKGPWWSQQNWSGKYLVLFPLYLFWQLILIAWYLWTIVRLRPNALHVMSKDDFISATLAAKFTGRRVIWTDCADLKFLFTNHTIWYKNPVGKLVYLVSHLANTVTLVSKSEQSLIEEQLHHPVSNNYRVVYLVGRDATVEPVNRPSDMLIFCATSRLVIAKGVGELIDAFTSISGDNPSYLLWIVGDGPDADKFRTQAAKNSSIIFLGHQDEPLKYLAAADIYVHPTHHEGFSLGLAEAAMLAKPIIATNVGGNPELVGDTNGILVPAQDSVALAAAMDKIAHSPKDRVKMGEHGRRDFVNKFDLAQVAKREILPLYEN